MTKYNIKQVEVARETGIHHSSLSLWLQGKIKGHMVKISETIENYLENFMSNKPRMNTMHISKLNLLKSPNNKIDEDFDMNNGFGTLIPIKLDLEIEGKKLKENFLWDKNEPYLTLESFAKIMLEEYNLPDQFENEIINSMKKQINSFRTYKPVEGELVRVIKLNDFAESLCADLGLGSEFMLPIAHQIREQILEYQRTAHQDKRYQTYYNKSNDYAYGSARNLAVLDQQRIGSGPYDLGDGVKTMIRSLDQLFQPQQQNVSKFFQPSPVDEPFNGWSPDVQILSESDLKKIEKQEERKARQNQSLPNLKLTKKVSQDIYKVNRKIKIKDEELPFTNTSFKVRSPAYGNQVISKANDVLQKTYYNVAHPPNKNPLNKIKTQNSLATTCDFIGDIESTKFCKYSQEFIRAKQKQERLEDDLNNDITKSIQKASSVADYFKNYGFFYLTKTSQNFANTIQSLANYEKQAVNELTNWHNKKIDFKKKEGSDYKQAIQHDKTIQDQELLLRNKAIQQSEILEATNTQLKSVLKQKAEMFQPGKSFKLLQQLSPTSKGKVDVKAQTMYNSKLPNITSLQNTNATKSTFSNIKVEHLDNNNQIEAIKEELHELDTSKSNNTMVQKDKIIKPLSKKQMWELKERATTVEVKLQYTIIKLNEQRDEMNNKLKGLRMENCELSDLIKSKYATKLLEIKAETEFQTSIYNEGLTASTTKSKSPNPKGLATSMNKTSKVEDFMKIKAIRDQLNQKKEKIHLKIKKCQERIQNNIQQIHMLEFEVEQIKKDIVTTQQEQVVHYQALLKEGIDSRKDGLIWIIKALWLLAQDAHVEYFPQYLDSECIKFLLEYAKLDIKRSELHNMLKDMKLQARQDRISQVFKHKAQNSSMSLEIEHKNGSPPPKSFGFFQQQQHQQHHHKSNLRSITTKDLFSTKTKEEIMKQARDKLHQMAQTIEVTSEETQNNQDIDLLLQLQEDNEYQENSEHSSLEVTENILPVKYSSIMEGRSSMRRTSSLLDIEQIQNNIDKGDKRTLEEETRNIERRYNQLKNKMKKMKAEELERIGKEFLLNNYQKRFKVHQEVVLAAIVGEDKAKSTMANQIKKQDEYKRILEKNRTFTFASLRQTTTHNQRSTIHTLNKM